jgi:hypothetical protein
MAFRRLPVHHGTATLRIHFLDLPDGGAPVDRQRAARSCQATAKAGDLAES